MTANRSSSNDRPSPIWLSAIVAWSSFIGAAVVTMLLLVLGPRLNDEGFGWALLGRWFLLCWLTCLVPVICALSLVLRPQEPPT